MSVSTIHRLDKIVFPSSFEITQLSNQRWNAGIDDILQYPAGHTHPMFVANKGQKPAVEFTTTQLGALLAAIGVGGASFGSINTYFKLGSATGNVARATTSHMRVAIASSVGYWSSVRLQHNAEGEANVMIAANFDGTNDPFVYTGSVALSGNLTATQFYGAGPVSINGSAIPGIKEIEISSGISLLEEGASTEEFDTFKGIQQTAPTVTIRTLEAVNWATLGLRGSTLNGSSGLVFYARKFSANGSRVADATAQHIKFIGLLGMAKPVDSSGDGSSPITDTLRCVLVSGSDSILPLTVDTASTIT